MAATNLHRDRVADKLHAKASFAILGAIKRAPCSQCSQLDYPIFRLCTSSFSSKSAHTHTCTDSRTLTPDALQPASQLEQGILARLSMANSWVILTLSPSLASSVHVSLVSLGHAIRCCGM